MKFTTTRHYTKHPEDFESLLQYDGEKITDILEEFALGYGHKITTNYFNNESIKIQKTAQVSIEPFTFDTNS